jgi:arginine deiminase
VAQEEHDVFKKHLVDNGVEVLYIEELVKQTLDENPNLKKDFIEQFISEAKIKKNYVDKYRNFLNGKSNLEIVKNMIAGTKKIQLNIDDNDDYPFVTDPLPNILFQRDPFASIGNGITIHKM